MHRLDRNLHITEQVLSEDDTVELFGIRYNDHGGRVNKLVVQLQLRVLVLQRLRRDFPPQPRAGKHICFVDGVDRQRRVCSQSNLSSNTGDALHFSDAVDHGVPSGVFHGTSPVLLAGAEVGTSDELTYDDDIDTLCDRRLQGRVVQKTV